MARLTVLERDQLTPELATLADRAAASGQATMFQVLGHCPEMFAAYFQFLMIGQYIGFGRLLMVLDLERPTCTL